MLQYLIASMLISFGISIALVEKGKEWPIKKYNVLLRQFIHDYIYWKSASVLSCTVCTSFWAALLVDIILYISCGHFMWPLSGFASLGFTWLVIEFINATPYRINIT